jgi:hypothetical protein
MKSGYVMDFSDRTFREFVSDAIGIDIFLAKYHHGTNSKANRLRGFLKVESNYLAGKLIKAFCDYWLGRVRTGQIDFGPEEELYKECLRIAERLGSETIVEHIDALNPSSDDKDLGRLKQSIKESIDKQEPEAALDRLHTFLVKYVRQLCETHKLSVKKDDPLNSLFGKYVKHVVANKFIDSVMSEKILRFSINVLDAFNDVRNNYSFAHDNPLLNYNESLLIFNNIFNLITFIETIEHPVHKAEEQQQVDWTDLPF